MVLAMSYGDFFVDYKTHRAACSTNYWVGCAVGALGMAAIGFVSLWVAGAFVP